MILLGLWFLFGFAFLCVSAWQVHRTLFSDKPLGLVPEGRDVYRREHSEVIQLRQERNVPRSEDISLRWRLIFAIALESYKH